MLPRSESSTRVSRSRMYLEKTTTLICARNGWKINTMQGKVDNFKRRLVGKLASNK